MYGNSSIETVLLLVDIQPEVKLDPAPQSSKFRIEARPATVRKQAENQLRRAISEGHFAPGEHLPDRALQEMMQVSRTVVREAIRQLEAEGLVETVPHRGSFVKIISPDEARQIYAVREVLEALAAREFTNNASPEQLDALEGALNAIAAHSEASLISMKQTFYDVLLDGCGNVYVKKMLSQILNQNMRLRATTMSDPKRLPKTVEELKKLVEAARRKDPVAAGKAMQLHVRNAAKAALAILDSTAADDGTN